MQARIKNFDKKVLNFGNSRGLAYKQRNDMSTNIECQDRTSK